MSLEGFQRAYPHQITIAIPPPGQAHDADAREDEQGGGHKGGHRFEVAHRYGVGMEQEVDAQEEHAQQATEAAADEAPDHVLLDPSSMAMGCK